MNLAAKNGLRLMVLVLLGLARLTWAQPGSIAEPNIHKDIRGIERRLDRVEARLGRSNRPGVQPNNALERRLQVLEQELLAANRRIDDLEQKLEDALANLAKVEASLKELMQAPTGPEQKEDG